LTAAALIRKWGEDEINRLKTPSVRACRAAAHRFGRPLWLARLGAEAGCHLQTRNALPVMRYLLIEHAQVASQLATIALRFLLETAKSLDELVQLHFRPIREPVDPLKPKREGNTKRDRHAGAGADRNPILGRHERSTSRMKTPVLSSVA
jgi:hypothetical protein